MKSLTFKYILSGKELKFEFTMPCEIEVVYLTKKTFNVIENFCIEVRIGPTTFRNIKNADDIFNKIQLAMENNAASYWEGKKDIIVGCPFDEQLIQA